jgi:hypothetical protein
MKQLLRYFQEHQCCELLKHRLAKENFLFEVGFLVSLYNYEQTQSSLKIFMLSLLLKKATQVCLLVLEKLVSLEN